MIKWKPLELVAVLATELRQGKKELRPNPLVQDIMTVQCSGLGRVIRLRRRKHRIQDQAELAFKYVSY